MISNIEMKHMLRREIRKKVYSLNREYCTEVNNKIYSRILDLPEYQRARMVFCYVGTSEEIQTISLIQRMLDEGKNVALPKCVGRGIMEAYSISSLNHLEVGAYGILEPITEGKESIAPSVLDLVIVPCLAANTMGSRIGYGGGFYDRYLKLTDACRIVLCRERMICNDIPMEEHDQKMDILVTEVRNVYCTL